MKTKEIRKARFMAGYSQKELAEIVGVSRQTINLIEADKYNPSLKICKNISRVLDCSLDELFGD